MAHILVVDGDPAALRACAADLANEGHDVVTATTGDDALRLVARHAPDLVVTEVGLPGMDGLELLNRVLDHDRSTLVVLNARSGGYKDSFMSWAADAYVVKSPGNGPLRATIAELLAVRTAPNLSAMRRAS